MSEREREWVSERERESERERKRESEKERERKRAGEIGRERERANESETQVSESEREKVRMSDIESRGSGDLLEDTIEDRQPASLRSGVGSTAEQRGHNLKHLKDFHFKAKARIWP